MGSFHFVAMDCSWKSYPTHLTANSILCLGRALQQGCRGNQGRDKYADRSPARSNARPNRLRRDKRQVNEDTPSLKHPKSESQKLSSGQVMPGAPIYLHQLLGYGHDEPKQLATA